VSIITSDDWRGKEEFVTLVAMEWIAHRAGNDPARIEPALTVADGVELDVHLLRGRLEVRHSKAVWPLRIYWERGQGIVDEQVDDLRTTLAAAPVGAHLWVDLKGFTPRLTSRVLQETGDRFDLTMSSRSWWVLRPARRRGGIRTFRSVGNRLQLWFALRIDHPDGVGIPERVATGTIIDRLRSRCSSIAVWGARDVDRVTQLRGLDVGVLIVDDLELISTQG
jgi:glycerophosphoryl diester phosphodiesterase